MGPVLWLYSQLPLALSLKALGVGVGHLLSEGIAPAVEPSTNASTSGALAGSFVYTDSIHDTDAALDLLAGHIIDQRASIELFSDRSRLQQDLMSDGAAAYLEKLLPSNQ